MATRLPASRLLARYLLALFAGTALAGEEAEHGKLEALKGEISRLQDQLRDATTQRQQLANELRATELGAADIQTRMQAVEHGITELNTQLSKLSEQLLALEAASKKQLQHIAADIAAAYRLGRQEPVKLVFNMEDPQSLGRNLRYYDYFLAARRDKLTRYRQTLSHLDTLKITIDSKQAELVARREQLQQQQLELTARRRERAQLLAAIEQQMDTGNSQLQQLSAEQQAIELIIKTLESERQQRALAAAQAAAEKAASATDEFEEPGDNTSQWATEASDEPAIASSSDAANSVFHSQRGRLPWPTEGVVANRYGAVRAASISWQGWLVLAAEGTPVRAIHRGTVVFADYLRGHGLLLIVDHGGGYLSLYAHNQVLLKKTGDQVAGGEVVARVGNTGGAGQSALYFEIRHQGRPIDPQPWLRSKA